MRRQLATPTPDAASAFIENSKFVWHQRFQLAPGVSTPGVSPVEWLCKQANIPSDLSGLTVLDIGTTNAGTAFELERRGAARVLAVDIFDPEWFGVRPLIEFLGSSVEYMRTSVYQLGDRLPEQFDLVIFWGVLYHLRHPLLALDNLRAVTRGRASLETAIYDDPVKRDRRSEPLVRFYRRDELGGDSSNWFCPTVTAAEEWCCSAGFEILRTDSWPGDPAARAMLSLRPAAGPAEFETISYERPLRCTTI